MKYTIIFSFLVIGILSAHAQIDGTSLIRASADKVKQLKTVHYSFVNERYFPSGNFTRQETEVFMKRLENGKSLVKLKGNRFLSLKNTTTNYSYSQHPNGIIYLNHDTKSAMLVDIALGLIGSLGGEESNVLGSQFDHLSRKDPMNSTDERNYTYEGTQKYGGVQCHVLSMPYGKKSDDTFYWYISEKDSIPRGYKFEGGMMEAKIITINEDMNDSDFILEVPESYEKSEINERNIGERYGVKRKASREGITYIEGTTPPKWEGTDLSGKVWSSEELAGKVVVIDFWGVWCLPCIKAMPKVQKLHDQYAKDGLIVLGFDVKDKLEKVTSFIKRNNYTYPIIQQADPLAKLFKVRSYPTFFIIGKDGKVAFAERGVRSNAYDDWSKVIKQELVK